MGFTFDRQTAGVSNGTRQTAAVCAYRNMAGEINKLVLRVNKERKKKSEARRQRSGREKQKVERLPRETGRAISRAKEMRKAGIRKAQTRRRFRIFHHQVRFSGLGEWFPDFAKAVPLVKRHGSKLRVQVDHFLRRGNIPQHCLQEERAHTAVAELRQDGKTLQLDAFFGFPPAGGGNGFIVEEKQVMTGFFLVLVFQGGRNSLFFDKNHFPNCAGWFRHRFILE
jgi:hypothetical protein